MAFFSRVPRPFAVAALFVTALSTGRVSRIRGGSCSQGAIDGERSGR